MSPEDAQNLAGWLQTILKEVQDARATNNEVRDAIKVLPEIRQSSQHGAKDSNDAERKIEIAQARLEDRMNKLESTLHDIRNTVNDIRNKVNRLK